MRLGLGNSLDEGIGFGGLCSVRFGEESLRVCVVAEGVQGFGGEFRNHGRGVLVLRG